MSLNTTTIALIAEETNSKMLNLLKKESTPPHWDFIKSSYSDANTLEADFFILFISIDVSKRIAQAMVNFLKEKQPHSPVFVVLEEGLRDQYSSFRSSMDVDNLFIYPPNRGELISSIKTHLVTASISKQFTLIEKGDKKRSRISFGKLLVDNHIIVEDDLNRALAYQQERGLLLGDALVELNLITEDQKVHFLGSQLSIPVANATTYAKIDLETVSLVPEHLARQHTCLPLKKKADGLEVILTDALNLPLLDTLRDRVGLKIIPILGTNADIKAALDRAYNDINTQKASQELSLDEDSSIEIIQDEVKKESIDDIRNESGEQGIIKLVNILIANAVRDRASDIHIEPQEKFVKVRYRIDGNLKEVMKPSKKSHQAIITRLKIIANLNIAERRLPQDGRMMVRTDGRAVDLRLSILPTIFGEKAVLRILDKESFKASMNNLGFTKREEEIFQKEISRPYGMVIVTGPTGSGKSTTLYSAVEAVKSENINIITVEDPVEFHMEGVSQVQVQNKIGLTFASALRTILRQDPDVVLIGEIRDDETADIAIKMALTGHMVLSTLHTNDASSAIARLVDIGIPPLLLTSALNLIIAQRLLRSICTNCREEITPDPHLQRILHLSDTQRFYKGKGCALCNGSGYRGRLGVFEMLPLSKDIKSSILKGAGSIEINELARSEGMRTLRESAMEAALRGETTLEEVLAATSEI